MVDNPSDSSDEALDAVLRDHFARVLDPQLGRAVAALEQQASNDAPRLTKRPAALRWRRWVGLGMAMAAAIAVMVVLRQASRPVAMPGPRPDPATQEMPFEPATPAPHAIVDTPERASDIKGGASTAVETPRAGVVSSQARPSADDKDDQNDESLARQRAKQRRRQGELIEVDSGTRLDDIRRQPLNTRGSRSK